MATSSPQSMPRLNPLTNQYEYHYPRKNNTASSEDGAANLAAYTTGKKNNNTTSNNSFSDYSNSAARPRREGKEGDKRSGAREEPTPFDLPYHPGHLVLPAQFVRQLNAIRLAGGSVRWIDLVVKVNKVKRHQQRLVILTDTHLYACLPEEGDIQRCLPLSEITAAHVHIPAAANLGPPMQYSHQNNPSGGAGSSSSTSQPSSPLGGSRRTRSVFGNLVEQPSGSSGADGSGRATDQYYSASYFNNNRAGGAGGQTSSYFNSGGPSLSSSSTAASMVSRAKCEVLLICPTEYDLLFFVNDVTFQHFAHVLTTPQERASMNMGIGGGLLASSFGGPSSPNMTNSQSSAAQQQPFYSVPLFEVPQPILQTPALMSRARLEKPPRYTRTKAARFVTTFAKLVAPRPLPPSHQRGWGGVRDREGGGSSSSNDHHRSEVDADLRRKTVSYKDDVQGLKASESEARRGNEVADEEDVAFKRKAARQRAISLHIPLPGADDRAVSEAKKEAARIQESQSIAGPVAVPSDAEEDEDKNDDEDNETEGQQLDKKKNNVLTSKAMSGDSNTEDSTAPAHGGRGSNEGDDNEADDLLEEMEADQRRRRGEPGRADQAASSSAPATAGNSTTNVRWASPTPSPAPSSSAPAISSSRKPQRDIKEEEEEEHKRKRHQNNKQFSEDFSSSSDSSDSEAMSDSANNVVRRRRNTTATTNDIEKEALGTREGWLAILKAHKSQNDALRRIIADLQQQVKVLSRENETLKDKGTGGGGGGVTPTRSGLASARATVVGLRDESGWQGVSHGEMPSSPHHPYAPPSTAQPSNDASNTEKPTGPLTATEINDSDI